jgi:hypothetical protein
MNPLHEFDKVISEIKESGGNASAKILIEISENYHSLLNSEHFDPQKFLSSIWQNVNGIGDNTINTMKDETIRRIGAGNINLIPSEIPGPCRPFCLALASGNFGEKYYPSKGVIGFKGMMSKLVETWFTCLSVNEENLVLTSDWDESTFKELYKKLINSYCRNHGKKIFIVLVSDSNVRLMHSA